MRENSQSEEKFMTLITNRDLKLSIDLIRKAVESIWTSEAKIISDYTDHGFDHCQRILQKLEEVLFMQKNFKLEEDEAYLLILGVYLHDIGMQCDIKKNPDIKKIAEEKYGAKFDVIFTKGIASSYSEIEQNEMRKNHHLLTAAWIEYSYKNSDAILSTAIQTVEQSYVEDLIDICKYHSKLKIMDCGEESELNKIRKRLIASILRFGDELDIDKNRVEIDTVKAFGYKVENSMYWYIHHRTQIKILNNEIILIVNLHPEDYALCKEVLEKIVIKQFKDKNKILTDILIQNSIPISISEKSAVRINEFTKRIPSEEFNELLKLVKKK